MTLRALPWLALAAALAVILVLLFLLHRADVARQAALRAAERPVLQKAGAVVAVPDRAPEKIVPALARHIRRVREASPGAKVTESADLTFDGTAAGKPAKGDADATAQRPCLLRAGDAAELRTQTAEIVTDSGNTAVVGVASLVRTDPKPVTQVWSGEMRVEASRLAIAPERVPEPPRTLYGLDLGISARHDGLGATIGGRVYPKALRMPRWAGSARLGFFGQITAGAGAPEGTAGVSILR